MQFWDSHLHALLWWLHIWHIFQQTYNYIISNTNPPQRDPTVLGIYQKSATSKKNFKQQFQNPSWTLFSTTTSFPLGTCCGKSQLPLFGGTPVPCVLSLESSPAWQRGWTTLPETNSSPLKIGHPKGKFIFQPSIFRCYVSFGECTHLNKNMHKSNWIISLRFWDENSKTILEVSPPSLVFYVAEMMGNQVPSRDISDISHQTGKPENHWLKSAGWEGERLVPRRVNHHNPHMCQGLNSHYFHSLYCAADMHINQQDGLGMWACVLGSKLPLFPYNRRWSSTQ